MRIHVLVDLEAGSASTSSVEVWRGMDDDVVEEESVVVDLSGPRKKTRKITDVTATTTTTTQRMYVSGFGFSGALLYRFCDGCVTSQSRSS